MLGSKGGVVEVVEQAQLLFQQERPKQAAVGERDLAEPLELGDRLALGRLEQRPATPLTHFPPAVSDLPFAFHSERRTSSTARAASFETWKGSMQTSASGSPSLTAFA